MLAALVDFLTPQRCLGCRVPGEALCGLCLAPEPARRVPDPAPEGLPECWSAGAYEGPLRQAVLACKERGRSALAQPLGQALAYVLTHALPSASPPDPGKPGAGVPAPRPRPLGAVPPPPLTLVPVPSARRAVRGRGHDPVAALA
ncbi:MAG: ComF family protein, partial [Thermoactinospora sp.]|nr:ComF family protein [Thermoactinospora sp.]